VIRRIVILWKCDRCEYEKEEYYGTEESNQPTIRCLPAGWEYVGTRPDVECNYHSKEANEDGAASPCIMCKRWVLTSDEWAELETLRNAAQMDPNLGTAAQHLLLGSFCECDELDVKS